MKLSDPLRLWLSDNEAWTKEIPGVYDELSSIADAIDLEHEQRMDSAKREVRRVMARDMRWATTMLEARESRRHIKEGLYGGSE